MNKLFFTLLIGLLGWSCTSDNELPPPPPVAKSDIHDVMSKINQYLVVNKGTSVLDNISEAYVNEKDSIVVVGLVDCSEQKVEDFKSTVCNDLTLRFIQCKRLQSINPQSVPATTRTVIGGTSVGQIKSGSILWKKLEDNTMQYCGTVAYRAMRKGVKGFVMSAQAVVQGTVVYVQTGASSTGIPYQIVGTCTAQKRGGTTNAAFCTLAPGIKELDNQVPENENLRYSTYIASSRPVVDSEVLMFGNQAMEQTGKPGSGRILSRFATYVDDDNIPYTNMIKADYASYADDFGGLVLNPASKGPAPTGLCDVLGVHSAGNSSYGYFAYVESVNEILELMLY